MIRPDSLAGRVVGWLSGRALTAYLWVAGFFGL